MTDDGATPPRRLVAGGRPGTPDERGFIIVAVLWMLSSLAALAVIYTVFVATSSATVALNNDRVQVEALVAAAAEMVCHRLLAAPDPTERAAQGRFDIRIGQASLQVSYLPEAARIDLNAAPKALLAKLMVELGEAPQRADNSADRIIAWRSPIAPGAADSDPETASYRMAGSAYQPRHAPFPHVDELWSVRGIPAATIERMIPYVTVLNGFPSIDLRAAAPQVIAALPGMTPDRLRRILALRQAGQVDPRRLQQLAAPDADLVRFDNLRAVRIAVEIAYDAPGRRFAYDVVILVPDGGAEPYRLVARSDRTAMAVSSRAQQAGAR